MAKHLTKVNTSNQAGHSVWDTSRLLLPGLRHTLEVCSCFCHQPSMNTSCGPGVCTDPAALLMCPTSSAHTRCAWGGPSALHQARSSDRNHCYSFTDLTPGLAGHEISSIPSCPSLSQGPFQAFIQLLLRDPMDLPCFCLFPLKIQTASLLIRDL